MFPFLTRADSEYPFLLKEIDTPPKKLWYEGDPSLLSEKICIAIVGARECTSYGEKIAFELARDLVRKKIIVVSGMAFGIDTAAHRGSLAGGGLTVAVLGCGIDIAYPKENRDLKVAIARQGLVLSEYAPGTEATPYTFPERNRIISGLSRGVVVVEARKKSGSLITARWALQQGREVFAVPGNITSPFSEGPHRLIQNGAKLVRDVSDILEELEYAVPLPLEDRTKEEEQKVLLSLLSNGKRHVDELSERSGFAVEKVSSLLLELELSGQVRPQAGGYYECPG